jgi:DNA-binding helix-hairpin-helix protein with protein kinase domain
VFAGFAAYFVPVKDGGIAVAALAFCSLAAATWPWVSREERIAANKVCQAQAVNWEGVLARWQREAGRDAFDQKLRSLEDAHAEISKLIERRRNQERQFQFDPSEAVHWREVEARIQKLLLELRQGPDELLRLGQEIKVTRARLMPMLEKAWDDLKIAEARRDAI